MWSWWRLDLVSLHDLVHVLAAILVWSILISAVSLCYELWRLQHKWRLGIAWQPLAFSKCARKADRTSIGQESALAGTSGVVAFSK